MVIVSVLILVIAGQTVTKVKKGSSCCGEHEETAKKIRVADKNKSNYPYSYILSIEGMVCSNCVRNVENALNACDGIWAKADLSQRTAKVLSKYPRDKQFFLDVMSNTSYTLVQYKDEGAALESEL